MKELQNKNVLITGATGGLGRQLSFEFAKRGSNLVLWSTTQSALNQLIEDCKRVNRNVKVYGYICDVSKREVVYQIAERVKDECGKIDVLVNNAGVICGKPFLQIKDEEFEQTIKINALAHVWTLKAFLPDMIEKDEGHIVTISSAAGLCGAPSMSDYSMSKFAIFGFQEAIRMELKKDNHHNIKTTVVCPAHIMTDMFKGYSNTNILAPSMTAEYVAKKTLYAIENDIPEISLPISSMIVYILRLLPVWIYDFILKFIGVFSAMDSFQGRIKLE